MKPVSFKSMDGHKKTIRKSWLKTIYRRIIRFFLTGALASIAVMANAESFSRPETYVVTGTITVPSGSFSNPFYTVSTNTHVNITGRLEVSSAAFTVASGSGFFILSSTGIIVSCSIIPPLDTASYLFNMITDDADEFPLFGFARQIIGKAVIFGDCYLSGPSKALISNASMDGSYKARCVIRQ